MALHRMFNIKNCKFITKAIYDMESIGIVNKNKINSKSDFSITIMGIEVLAVSKMKLN